MTKDTFKKYTEKDFISSKSTKWKDESNGKWPELPPNVEFTLHTKEQNDKCTFMIQRKYKDG